MKKRKSKIKLVVSLTTIGLIVGCPIVANANFLSNLLGGLTGGNSSGGSGAISSVFQSLSTGGFNFGNIGQLLSGITTSVSNPSSFGLGNLSSSGATPGSYGTGSLGSYSGGLTGAAGGLCGTGGNCNFSTTNLGGYAPGTSGGISPATAQKISASSGYIKNLYGSITKGNLSGILNNGIGLLGVLGITLPSQLSATSGSAGSPLGGSSSGVTSGIPSIDDELITATEPVNIWQAANKKRNVYPETNYNISQISLGEEGQKLSASQTEESTLAVSTAQDAVSENSQYVQDASELNTSQDNAAQSAAKLAEACAADKQSLDCLKKISGGLAVLSGQNSLVSAGQTLQLAATFQNSQIGATNAAIAKINGDRLQKIEIQAAATVSGVSTLASLADQAHQYELTKDQADLQGLTRSQGSFIVPGLFK
jgi:hypothetical protein